MAKVLDHQFPEDRYYDVTNQVWYVEDGEAIRVGFTPTAMTLAGEVLVFTPKRVGRDFEKDRSFATIECGKWIGAARAAFDGVVTGHNEDLIRRPELLNSDAFGAGWMLRVRPTPTDWRTGLITGPEIGPAFTAWLASEAYRER